MLFSLKEKNNDLEFKVLNNIISYDYCLIPIKLVSQFIQFDKSTTKITENLNTTNYSISKFMNILGKDVFIVNYDLDSIFFINNSITNLKESNIISGFCDGNIKNSIILPFFPENCKVINLNIDEVRWKRKEKINKF